jgi:hypothetical protein
LDFDYVIARTIKHSIQFRVSSSTVASIYSKNILVQYPQSIRRAPIIILLDFRRTHHQSLPTGDDNRSNGYPGICAHEDHFMVPENKLVEKLTESVGIWILLSRARSVGLDRLRELKINFALRVDRVRG